MIALPNREHHEGTDYQGSLRRMVRGPLDAVYQLCDKCGIRHGKLEYPGERRRLLEDLRGKNAALESRGAELERRLHELEAKRETVSPSVESMKTESSDQDSLRVDQAVEEDILRQGHVNRVSEAVDRVNRSYVASPHEATSGILRSSIALGTVGAGVGAAIGALPYAWQGALLGGGTYISGLVHNMLWKKNGKESPGKLGTFLRGIIAPVSIPVGIVRNLTWNRKAA